MCTKFRISLFFYYELIFDINQRIKLRNSKQRYVNSELPRSVLYLFIYFEKNPLWVEITFSVAISIWAISPFLLPSAFELSQVFEFIFVLLKLNMNMIGRFMANSYKITTCTYPEFLRSRLTFVGGGRPYFHENKNSNYACHLIGHIIKERKVL